ncbi:hypothetical protein HDU78_001213 [Chytriomyces hyalinus]|nr:hypothetical protein HDU78_001213 [Chytriomyces hyalinus]KAJ3265958.1 hypothetical protein HDU77_003048 [Chytriomyces hyalinus]
MGHQDYDEPQLAPAPTPTLTPTPGTSFTFASTKSTRGRKKSHTAPVSKKQAQQRAAQAAYLERKQNYVRGLEQRVAELTAIISGGGSNILELNVALSKENEALRAENEALRVRLNSENRDCPVCAMRHSPVGAGADSLTAPSASESPFLTDQWADASPEPGVESATDLYGPPDTTQLRIALKLIPSLQNNKNVDRLMDLFMTQASITNRKMIVKYAIRIINIFHKIIDATHIVDRQNAIEAITGFIETPINHAHILHTFNYSVTTVTASAELVYPGVNNPKAEPIPETPQLLAFRQYAFAIPGIAGCEALVDELFTLFWPSENVENAAEENIKKFMRVFAIMRLLMEACDTFEDRCKVMLLVETWRFGNRSKMDELTEEIEDLAIC